MMRQGNKIIDCGIRFIFVKRECGNCSSDFIIANSNPVRPESSRLPPTDFYESDRTSRVRSDSEPTSSDVWLTSDIIGGLFFDDFSDSKLLSEVRAGLRQMLLDSDRVRLDSSKTQYYCLNKL